MRQYKVFVILIQVILMNQPIHAGFERTSQPTSVLARSSGGIALLSSDNLWINPASIAGESGLHTSIYYSPSPFGLSQLANYGMLVSDHYSMFAFGFAVQSFGFSLYRESTGSWNVAWKGSDDISVGTTVHLYHLNIAHYGSAVRTVIDAGFVYAVNGSITIGTALYNLTGNSFGGEDDIPQKIATGICYRSAPYGAVIFDIHKDLRYPLYYTIGIEFTPLDPVRLCGGMDSRTSMISAGAGFTFSTIRFDYGVSSHAVLGLTHSIGVSFGWE